MKLLILVHLPDHIITEQTNIAFLTIEISGYFECHRFLTKTILYNHVIIIGNYHRHFTLY